MNIQTFSNLLSPEDFEKACAYFDKPVWQYAKMGTYGYPTRESWHERFMWKAEVMHEPVFRDVLWAKVRECIGDDYELIYAHGNGQGVNQSAIVHKDAPFDGVTHAFVFYAHREWQLHWGGRLLFWDEGQEIGIPPIPNMGVFSDARILHQAQAPSIECSQLRISVAYKLKKRG